MGIEERLFDKLDEEGTHSEGHHSGAEDHRIWILGVTLYGLGGQIVGVLSRIQRACA